jgi:putative tributyrin esterase
LMVHTSEHVSSLPAGAPLVVLLHGVYGSFWNWTLLGRAHLTLDRLVSDGRVRPMVLATPSDGLAGEGTAYLPHPDADYEAWVMSDVIDCVGELVDAVTDASPIFLGGNSMGGFGAARLGLRHPSRTAGIAIHSAITKLDQLAAFTVGDIGDDARVAPGERDLLAAFDACTTTIPPLSIDCGRSDPLLAANRDLHAALEERCITHHYEEFDGDHNWDAWAERIEHSLLFFNNLLEEAR